jgi:hypothetical protein
VTAVDAVTSTGESRTPSWIDRFMDGFLSVCSGPGSEPFEDDFSTGHRQSTDWISLGSARDPSWCSTISMMSIKKIFCS